MMALQGQKFVVIGGAGLIGSAVAHNLVAAQGTGVIICDSVGPISDLKWANLPTMIDDLWAPDMLVTNLNKAWREIAGVIMLADGGHDSQDGDRLFQTAYHLPREIWDFCVVKQRPFFWASSAHVYGHGRSNLSSDPTLVAGLKPVTAFGRAKQAFDVFAARQGTGPNTPPTWAGLRLSSVYGAGEAHKGSLASLPVRALAHAKAGTTLKLPEHHDKIVRDWVHVDDAAAAIASITTGGHAGFFDIGTGVATTTPELMKHVETVCGKVVNLNTETTLPSAPTSLAIADSAALEAVGVSVQFRSVVQGLTAL